MTWRSFVRNFSATVTQCVLCGKKAIYMAGGKGFCTGHKADAEKLQRNLHLRKCARNEGWKDSHGDWEKMSDNKMRRAVTKKEWK